MTVLNLGSLNIDSVFRVGRIARPGETIASRSVAVFAGGKGANQSVALARAGVSVAHVGRVGPDGSWLLEKLAAEGVDVRRVLVGPGPTGQAMIQVDDDGQNAIVLSPGANHEITPRDVDESLDGCAAGGWFLAQNETSSVGEAIERAKNRGMRVALNPAPIDEQVRHYPLDLVDLLVVNATEGAALAGQGQPDAIVGVLTERWPHCEVVLTLGAQGVVRRGPDGEVRVPAPKVEALDSTAAGDTFLGYYLAGRIRGLGTKECLALACRAGALCVARPGAMDSIPCWLEVQGFG